MNAVPWFPPEEEPPSPLRFTGPMVVFGHSCFGSVANLFLLPGVEPLCAHLRCALEAAPNLRVIVFADPLKDCNGTHYPLLTDFNLEAVRWAIAAADEIEVQEAEPSFEEAIGQGLVESLRYRRKLTIRTAKDLVSAWSESLRGEIAQIKSGNEGSRPMS